eukprot:g6889.t1
MDELFNTAAGEVHEIQDEYEWNKRVKNNSSNFPKVVVFFNAVWCPPCRMIKTDFWELAQFHKRDQIVFLEVNVDKARNISNECRIHSLPTFLCFCEGEIVEEVVGRDKDKLNDAVVRLLGLPSSSRTSTVTQHPLLRFRPTSFKKLFKRLLRYT